jgi:hypothetical protein
MDYYSKTALVERITNAHSRAKQLVAKSEALCESAKTLIATSVDLGKTTANCSAVKDAKDRAA